MKSLDTNIIIRFLVNDDKKQGKAVRLLFERAESSNETLYITIAVLLEILWVLESVYHYSRVEILNAIESIASMSIIEFEKIDTVQKLISVGRDSRADLDDLLIGLSAKDSGCESTVTIDRSAARSDLFELIG
jgi:predicted nucleic-acid-binding protein